MVDAKEPIEQIPKEVEPVKARLRDHPDLLASAQNDIAERLTQTGRNF